MRKTTIALLCAALSLAACADSKSGQGESTGDLTVNLDWVGTAAATPAGADVGTPMSSSLPLVQVPSDVVKIQFALSNTTNGFSSGPVSIFVQLGSYTFVNVPTGTGYTLAIDTLNSAGQSTCSVAMTAIAVTAAQTTTVSADLSTCKPQLGLVSVSWGEGAITPGVPVTNSVDYNFSRWYVLAAVVSTAYTITLTPSSGNADLWIYNPDLNGNPQLTTSRANPGLTPDTFSFTPTSSHNVWIEVRGADATPAVSGYTLQVN